MKKLFGKYYLAILILAAASFLSVSGFQQGASVAGKKAAPPVLKDAKAIEQLKKDGSFDSLSEAMKAARYKIGRDGDTLLANNPANRIRAQFNKSGTLNLSGASKDSRSETAWQLKSFGRGTNQTEIGGGSWLFNGNRAELRRASFGLTEYFENTPDGLEQGFILSERADAAGAGESLSLMFQTDNEHLITADADGKGLTLTAKNGGEALRYEKLKAWDADGAQLSARMSVSDGEIRLEVEDATANYPVTTDPTFARTTKLTADDGAANDYFGTSVAVSGETVIVGEIMCSRPLTLLINFKKYPINL